MGNDFRRGIKVYLETSDYGKGIEAMVAATGKYEDKLAELRKEAEKMTAAGQNTGEAWDDLQTKIKQNETHLKTSQANEEEYRKKLEQTKKVLNNLSGVSYNELVKVQKQLQKELKDTSRGTEEHKTKLAQLERVNKEVSKSQAELNSNLGKNNSLFGRLTDVANKYFNIAIAGVAAITGISLTFRRLAEDVAKMDDVYSDVMKTTGLTKEEVIALNEQLKKLDTRTGREQLNRLASDAGKLGIEGSKNILDFVDAGNQINVALGEDLGEDAIKNIGKLTQTFAKSTKELEEKDLKGKMLAIGSAVNSIGQSSTAQESYLVEFAQRVSGAFSQAGISLQNTLGYASALDQTGQGLEMSATAMQQFVMKVFEDPAKFAKLAGIEVNKFRKLLGEDTNQAIITVLTSLSKKGGFAQLVPIFNQMGLDGARAVGVLSSLASNIELVNEAQEQANTSFKEGTSITNEYDVKNNNLAAKLDKAKKAFTETALELGEKLNPMLLKSVNGTTYLIKALVELPKWLKENKGLILTFTVVMTAYTLAVNKARISSALWYAGEKIKIFWTKASTAATLLHEAATGYLTGSTRAANVATKAFFNVLKVNPYIALGLAIAAVVVGLYKMVTGTKKISAEQTALKEVTASLNTEVERESINLEAYRKRLLQTEPNSKERIRLVKELTELYPDLLTNIDAEKASVTALDTAIKDYLKNMENNIRLKVIYSKISAKMSELEDAKDYSQRQSLLQQIEFLKKEYEYQMLVNSYGEENAKLLSKQSELRSQKASLQLAHDIQSYENFSKLWKSSNERNKIMYSSQKAETDALNKAYNEYVKKGKEGDEKLKSIEANLKKIDGIIANGGKDKKANKDKEPDPTYPAVDEKEQKKQYDKELKILQDSHNKRIAEIKSSAKTENELNMRLLGEDLSFYQNRQKLQEKYSQDTGDSEQKLSDTKLKIQQEYDKQLLGSINDSYKAINLSTDEFEKLEKQKLLDGYTTKEQYQLDSAALDILVNEKRLADAREYGELIADEAFASEEFKKNAIEKANADIAKAEENLANSRKKYADTKYQQEEEYQRKRQALIDKYGLDGNQSIRAQYRKELTELKAAIDEKYSAEKDGQKKSLLSQEEYEQARKQVMLKAAADYAQQAVDYAGKVADAVSAYHQMESDSLEAQKQKDLKAAGDNAEARQAIEEEYAQKELDLKKKQSGADMAIKIVQAIAAGALGIANIWAHHADNPVLAGILTGIETAAVGIQIASLIKQREAIMNTTLDSSGSSDSSSASSGTRVAQAASGRWDVIGEEDGKVYRNVPYRGVARTGIITAPTLVAEQGDEAIIDNPTLRNIRMNAPWILSVINKMRVPQRASGSYPETVSQSSSGSFSQTTNDTLLTANMEVLKRLVVLLTFLIDNGIDANVYLDKLEKKIALKNKSLKKGSS